MSDEEVETKKPKKAKAKDAYFAFVDVPGQPPNRGTIAIKAVSKSTGPSGETVPAEYDELNPNKAGVVVCPANHRNYELRLAVIAQKQKRENRPGQTPVIVGPYPDPDSAVKAAFKSRPLDAKEELLMSRQEHDHKDAEIEELKAKLAKLANEPAAPTVKAPAPPTQTK